MDGHQIGEPGADDGVEVVGHDVIDDVALGHRPRGLSGPAPPGNVRGLLS